nr:MAG TPA: hypothetical protein [Caudoviricetes sp.]
MTIVGIPQTRRTLLSRETIGLEGSAICILSPTLRRTKLRKR